MQEGKQPHILNASSNLIGICFVLITGIKLTGNGDQTIADEISLFSAFGFLGSCFLSYYSIRSKKFSQHCEQLADYAFLASLTAMFVAICVLTHDFI